MQECFRKYPEIYGSELEDADAAEADAPADAPAEGQEAATPAAVVTAPEPFPEDRQKLREVVVKGGHSNGAETDNLPGVRLVERVTEEAAEKKEQK